MLSREGRSPATTSKEEAMKTLKQITNKMKREILMKSDETGKLKTVRVSVMSEIADELEKHKNRNDAAKKALGYIQRDVNRVYNEGVPPRRGELKKAYETLVKAQSKSERKATTKKNKKAA